jgi:hypothetical protein
VRGIYEPIKYGQWMGTIECLEDATNCTTIAQVERLELEFPSVSGSSLVVNLQFKCAARLGHFLSSFDLCLSERMPKPRIFTSTLRASVGRRDEINASRRSLENRFASRGDHQNYSRRIKTLRCSRAAGLLTVTVKPRVVCQSSLC